MARMQPPTWDRWSGHYQQNTQYSTMDASAMMPYDPRTTTAPMQTHPHGPQYAIGTTYAMASVPSMAPVSGMPPHSNFGVNQYTPTSPSSMVMSYRSYADERSSINEPSHGVHYHAREVPPMYRQEQGSSPQIKSDPMPSGQLPLPPVPKLRTPAEAAAPKPTPFIGETPIDEMMRKIQAQNDEDEEEEEEEEDEEEEDEEDEGLISPKAYQSPPCSNASGSRSSSPRSTRSKRRNSKTHHKEKRRCTWEGCEKPYACDQCSKTFAQKGNLRAHQSVHDPTKRFHCLIEGCHKPFTQRGNLKNHQNKFHKESVAKYTALFAQKAYTELSEEDQKIFLHFKEIYAKMNQGIKGRGVGRSIQKKSANNSQTFQEMSNYSMQQRTPPMEHSLPLHQFSQLSVHNPSNLPQHGLPPQAQTWQGYSIPRDGGYQPIHTARPQYEMYEMEHEPISSNASSAGTLNTPTASIYEEEHNRGLAFRDRY
ncbi:hypothetical protein TruAng_011909 [Truncatella angustata]|nr:hypothetical protein TruAng_011909 [Truncatella angustata]